jgi:hypothetical protein
MESKRLGWTQPETISSSPAYSERTITVWTLWTQMGINCHDLFDLELECDAVRHQYFQLEALTPHCVAVKTKIEQVVTVYAHLGPSLFRVYADTELGVRFSFLWTVWGLKSTRTHYRSQLSIISHLLRRRLDRWMSDRRRKWYCGWQTKAKANIPPTTWVVKASTTKTISWTNLSAIQDSSGKEKIRMPRMLATWPDWWPSRNKRTTASFGTQFYKIIVVHRWS